MINDIPGDFANAPYDFCAVADDIHYHVGDSRNSSSAAQTIRLHPFTGVLTQECCLNLTKIISNENICKLQSNRLISLIKSALPEPNNMPSSLKESLPMMNIEDIFTTRKVCILCKRELLYDEKFCKNCLSTNKTTITPIFDVEPIKLC